MEFNYLDKEKHDQDEEESFGTSHGFSSVTGIENEEQQLEERNQHIYQTFISPVIHEYEDGQTINIEDIQEQINPPYSEKEIEDALSHALNETDEVMRQNSHFEYNIE